MDPDSLLNIEVFIPGDMAARESIKSIRDLNGVKTYLYIVPWCKVGDKYEPDNAILLWIPVFVLPLNF